MGVVYRAHDRSRGTTVALKTLRRVHPNDIYRLKAEFRALGDLDHPNLVRLEELFCDRGQWFFTMELVEGVDFLTYVRAQGAETPPSPADTTLPRSDLPETVGRSAGGLRCDVTRLRTALAQLAAGVGALHAVGKVHRDIKPSNVLVTPEGRAVLLDFGLVRDLDVGSESSDGEIVGTVLYMAPEQAAGGSVGPEADWYALGGMLFEALTGRPPFEGTVVQVMADRRRIEPPPPGMVATGVPPDLDALCAALLRIDPCARPQARELLGRLGVRPGSVPGALQSPTTVAATFVGRDAELAVLRAAYASSRAERTVAVVLRGGSGIGKSALARRFADELYADGSGAVVLAGRCYERESVPYQGVDGVIDALSRHLSRIDPVDAALLLPPDAALVAHVFPVLRRVRAVARMAEPRHRARDPIELRTRTFAALREILCRFARRQPLVVFIDDLQWADADSLRLLGDVLHPPDAPPVLLLATLRDEGGPPGAHPTPTLPCEVQELPLGALPPTGALALARALLASLGADVGAAGPVVEEAHGHPLFIQEITSHIATTGALHADGVRLDGALRARASTLEPSARDLLDAVAVAGVPVTLAVVCDAAGLDLAEGGRRAMQLRALHFIRTASLDGLVESYHDRVREAVTAGLTDARRREIHHRLADALEGSGASERNPHVLVRHLDAAGMSARAATYAARAAARAVEALAFDQAAELYDTALRLGTYDDDARRALCLLRGEALTHAGRGVEAAECFLAALEGADATTGLECRRRAAEQWLFAGEVERGLTALREIERELDVHIRTSFAGALLSIARHRALARLRGYRWTRRDPGEVAPRDLTRVDTYSAFGAGYGMVDPVRASEFQARGLLLALECGEPVRVARALVLEASSVAITGGPHIAQARDLLERAEQIGRDLDSAQVRAWAAVARGYVDYYDCRFTSSAARFLDAEGMLLGTHAGFARDLSNARTMLLFSLRHTGGLRELRWRLDDYLRDARRRDDRHTESTLLRSCHVAWLMDDAPDVGRAALEQARWVPPSVGFHVQHLYELRARVEYDLYEGRAGEASPRLADGLDALRRALLTRYAQIYRAERRWLLARVLLAQAEAGRNVVRALAEASGLAAKLEREGVGYALAWGALVRGGVAALRGDPAGALGHLAEGARVADAHDMRLLGAAARRRAGGLRGGDEGARQVAEVDAWMAAEGVRAPARLVAVFAPGFGAAERVGRLAGRSG